VRWILKVIMVRQISLRSDCVEIHAVYENEAPACLPASCSIARIVVQIFGYVRENLICESHLGSSAPRLRGEYSYV
jgi:hypothetical protein